MEKQLRTQTTTLVANTQATFTWSGNDFITAFRESIIKKPVSIRFTCSTGSPNSVNVGVRYTTLSKSYQIAERQTLFIIPAGTSVEITPSSKPALGSLDANIISISVDMISASAGSVSVALIIDDEPPWNTADPGNLIGLDEKFNLDYLPIAYNNYAGIVAGGTNIAVYTVPAGKRFFLDFIMLTIDITPVYPGAIVVTMNVTINGNATVSRFYSHKYDHHTVIFPPITTPLSAGDVISLFIANNTGVAKEFTFTLFGRESF